MSGLQFEALERRILPAVFIVINTADNGPGSLRQAILDANSNTGDDTVQFASGATGTITLTSGELAIADDSLDIQGPASLRSAATTHSASLMLPPTRPSAV